ncbi:MAG: YcaO-like family protein [Clostridia bacterium]|nr:YcaO-like family protein [Clostridia bacterium]
MSEKKFLASASLLDADFKDDSPEKTVESIKNILTKHGITTTERWNESGVDYCYSLRLSVDGTSFGVNGKGLTREFALASAYGELMERMQLGLFGDSSVQKLGFYDSSVGIDNLLSGDEVYSQLSAWYDLLASKVSKIDGESISGRLLLTNFEDKNGDIISTRFYNLMTREDVYVPRKLRCLVCGSNGGAAGNSMEEAVVQAISEIVERHYKQKIIQGALSLPDIPENVLKKFKVAYSIIENLRERGLHVSVKDASLGTRFPVVCVCYINKKTGKYHTHFGAFPVLEIALERTLTESFQGRSIDNFTKNDSFIYDNSELNTYASIYMDLKKGDFTKSVDFFVGNIAYDYNPNVGFDGKNSSELLAQIVEFFANQGCEILVRDASSLGFPTYNVLIPGYSEIIIHSISKKHNSFANLQDAVELMRNPKKMSLEDSILLILHINEMKKLGSIYDRLFSFATSANLPLSIDKARDTHLIFSTLCYAYYNIGNYTKLLPCLSKLISVSSDVEYEYLLLLNRYFSLVLNGYKKEKIQRLLEIFHTNESVRCLYELMENGKNPFERFVISCSDGCENCAIKEKCHLNYTSSLVNLVQSGAKSVSFDEFKKCIDKYAQI